MVRAHDAIRYLHNNLWTENLAVKLLLYANTFNTQWTWNLNQFLLNYFNLTKHWGNFLAYQNHARENILNCMIVTKKCYMQIKLARISQCALSERNHRQMNICSKVLLPSKKRGRGTSFLVADISIGVRSVVNSCNWKVHEEVWQIWWLLYGCAH